MVFIGMGTNIGNHGQRVRLFRLAIQKIAAQSATRVIAVSRIYETPPWGVVDQDSFYNAVAAIQTSIAPTPLLQALKSLETQLGRKERQRWGPREIDLDILMMGQMRFRSRQLIVPHPELINREFALVPLLEIYPKAALPGGRLLAHGAG